MFALNVTHRFNVSSNALYWLVISLVVLVSLGLFLGFLTPILAIITCIPAAANLFLADDPENLVYVVRILATTALFLLGPGAYSIDAKLFGLRVTVVPPRTNTI